MKSMGFLIEKKREGTETVSTDNTISSINLLNLFLFFLYALIPKKGFPRKLCLKISDCKILSYDWGNVWTPVLWWLRKRKNFLIQISVSHFSLAKRRVFFSPFFVSLQSKWFCAAKNWSSPNRKASFFSLLW